MSKPKRHRPGLAGKQPVMLPDDSGEWVNLSEYYLLHDEVATLRAKVEWLQKADRLVCWNGTEWEPRIQIQRDPPPRP